jgi:hypothetical protein
MSCPSLLETAGIRGRNLREFNTVYTSFSRKVCLSAGYVVAENETRNNVNMFQNNLFSWFR